MKKSVMQKWVKALTSGKYRQVTGKLRKKRGDKACGHCCLGVLCDLYAKETGKGEWVKGFHTDYTFDLGHQEEDSDLPPAVRKWAGMKTSNGKLKTPVPYGEDEGFGCSTAESLIDLNDDAGFKFKDIAAVIRRRVNEL